MSVITEHGVRDALRGDNDVFIAQVVVVRRFMSDTKLFGVLRDSPVLDADSFDVVLSDGVLQSKFLLAPRLNKLVFQNTLRAHRLVKVLKFYSHCDESSFKQHPVFVLEDLEILEQTPATLLLRKKNVQLKWADKDSEEWHPSAGARGFYVDLHADGYLPEDPSWTPHKEELTLSDEGAAAAIASHMELSDLIANYKTLAVPPRILGRVVSKTQVFFFNTQDSKAFPFYAYVIIDDGTEQAAVVLWYSACRDFYTSITPGDVISIEGYKAKTSTTFSREHAPDARIEISVNSRNPEGKIRILPPVAAAQVGEPSFGADSPMLSIKAIRALDIDGAACHFAGVVAAIGRVEVSRYKRNFFRYRWIELIDETSPSRPLLVKVYAGSDARKLDQITAGDLIALHNLRARLFVSNSKVPKLRYLMTTKSSWFVSDEISAQALKDLPESERLAAVRTWAVLQQESIHPSNLIFVPFPPLAQRLMVPMQTHVDEMRAIIDSLQAMHHLERRSMVVQGHIVGIYCHDGSQSVKWHPITSFAKASKAAAKRRKLETSVKPGHGIIVDVSELSQHIRTTTSKLAKEPDTPLAGVTLTRTTITHMSPPQVYEPDEAQPDEPGPSPVWCVRIAGLNGTEFIDAALPLESGNEGSSLMSLPVPGMLALDDAGTVHQRAVKFCKAVANRRMVFVLDLFRANDDAEITVNRWLNPDDVSRAMEPE
eukprot:m.249705 g.249705  ORF g.249705 m.249705 type:complete len:711 (+) comp16266_c0_seq1:1075-3207(+)